MVEKYSNHFYHRKIPESQINKGLKKIRNELETIGSIELAIKATSVLEKILWIAFFVVGIGWLGYFLKGTIEDDNPKTSIRLPLKINDLEYPAITICSEITTKYAITEVLGDTLDASQELPSNFEMIRDKLIERYMNDLLYPQDVCYGEDKYEACQVKNSY